MNPKFSAWIKYYITDVIEQNPNYFKDHMNAWYNERSKNVGVICAYKKNSCLLYMNTPPQNTPVKPSGPPLAPNRRYDESVEEMNEVIEGIKTGTHTNSDLETFKKKLLSGKTNAVERTYQNPANRIFIDEEGGNIRYVYKIAYGSVVDKELVAYKKLKKHDSKNKHFLKLVSGAIEINENYSMFITEYKEGLEPENLLYTKLEVAKKQDEVERLEGLIKSANDYLLKAGINHGDIAGNLYEVDGTFFWIDFEIQTSSSSATGLFGSDSKSESFDSYGDLEKSPVKKPRGSEERPSGPVRHLEFGGKKNKKSKKKRKARSSRKKSRKSSKKR